MRITARGAALLTAAAVLLLTGFRFRYAELTLLGTAALIAVGCAAGLAVWRPRLAVDRVADPDRVGRGEPATMTLTVRNRGRLRAASLIAEDRCGPRTVAVPLLPLRPGRDTTVRYPVPTVRRGVIPVGPLRITARDALGLMTLARSVGDVVQVWVHPRIHPLGAVPAGVTRSLDGRLDRVPHGSITFDALREYVVGDELRRVHWRTSARVGELMVREHVDTSLPRIVVLLDDRAAAHPVVVDGVAETFESACEATASVVAAAHRDGLPVTLLLVAEVAGGVPDPPTRTGSHNPAQAATGVAAHATGGKPQHATTGKLPHATGRDPAPAASGVPAPAGGFLDRLAEVTLHGGTATPSRTDIQVTSRHDTAAPSGTGTGASSRRDTATATGRTGGDDAMAAVTNRLRRDRWGDTLVYLTGPGAVGDLGLLGTPAVVVGIFGADGAAPGGVPGMVVIAAADGAEFAAEWNGVGRC